MWISRLSKLFVAVTTFVIAISSLVYFFKASAVSIFGKEDGSCFLISPYKDINYKVFGRVFEPTLTLPINTTNGVKSVEFLVDSGAVVSTIPNDIAKEIFSGSFDNLERTVLRGFGGGESFGYAGEMAIRLDSNKYLKVPVVFSESNSTRAILGRKGFLEVLTTKLDHQGKHLCIIE